MMMNCLQSWPEPIVRVQSLSDSGIRVIPERYVKVPSDRPSFFSAAAQAEEIPVVDFRNIYSDDDAVREAAADQISRACKEWGFFQVVNHGVDPEMMRKTREAWREFFRLPEEEKQQYANSPTTYEGYGSRLGVEKGMKLDWSDYFFLHYLPTPLRDENKWPHLPSSSSRELIRSYNEELVKICGKLMKVLSVSLGLKEEYLEEAFGGDQVGACMRVNFYPKCPQPDLTLGLSPHSDPGGLTLLLPDENVSGLQVRRANHWITVKPVQNAFIVNIGDQIQVLSNSTFKSVEHRVIVNSDKERLSLAFFYNPKGDTLIQPAPELVNQDFPAKYSPMTFNDYRVFIRTSGPRGKSHLECIQSPR